MRRRDLFLLGAVVLAALAAAAVAITYAAFRGTTSNPASSFSAKRVFPAARTTYSWTIRDASGGGAETNADDPFAVGGDGRASAANGTSWSTTFSGTKYLEWDYEGHLPAGIAASNATFSFRILGATTTDNICWYVATYVNSTNALISDHGSGSAQCVSGAYATQTVALSELTTTDQLNDLTVRVYVRDATAARKTTVDLANVTASYLSTATTQRETTYRDVSGAAATTVWSLYDGADASSYSIASNVTTAFGAARYMKFASVGDLPSGAVVTGATLTIVFHSSTNVQSCYYTEAYTGGGATLLGTHPTSGSPNCAPNTTPATTTASFPEITTAAQANDLTWKVYVRNAGSRKLVFDQVKLDLTWYYD